MKSILDISSWLALFAQIIITAAILIKASPIPLHWNILGEIDAVGSSTNALLLLLLSVAVFVGISIICRKPHLWNMPRKYHDPSYAFAVTSHLLSYVRLLTQILMLFISIEMLMDAELNFWVLGLIVGLLIGGIVYYISRLMRA